MITRRLPQDGGTGPRIWQGFDVTGRAPAGLALEGS